ncbi:TadE/TadG family type IV pilus assembly protein [Roseomonas elaeocarpi]|uniref:TadE/TadG family type IV pilus assembly protein n=1 Tax=Roseomonas elaeocarpi TaxID=907779 RepID=A0ABV6JT99_9PROT
MTQLPAEPEPPQPVRRVAGAALGLLRRWQDLARRRARWAGDRRGSVALAFAASAVVLCGFAALSAEGGMLYLVQRRAQSTADAAALAAVTALNVRGRTVAFSAGREVAGLNGFAADARTTLAVNSPPATGAQSGNSQAFEVVLTRKTETALAGAVLGLREVTVRARAVATLQSSAPACLVALSGALTISNSSSFNSSGCAIGSNAAIAGAVTLAQSNSSIVTRMVSTVGTCSGCDNTRYTLTEGYRANAAPITNPYAGLDAKLKPSFSGTAQCQNNKATSISTSPVPIETSGKAYCGNLSIGNASSIPFPSGTYVFYNASLTIGSLSSVSCSGCTFLFLGDNAGSLSISNTSSVTMTAPALNKYDSDYNGMLFYRAATASAAGSSSSPTLNLQSVSSFNLSGGIYFPNAYVRVGNVSSASPSSCLPLVGGTLEIGQLSGFRFDVSGCSTFNTGTGQVVVARLVE